MGIIGTSLYFEIFGHPDSNVVSAKSGKMHLPQLVKGFNAFGGSAHSKGK
jgi:hypothetical protein